MDKCKSCGACPTCGRAYHGYYHYPYVPYYPYWNPVIQTTPTWTTITTTAGDSNTWTYGHNTTSFNINSSQIKG